MNTIATISYLRISMDIKNNNLTTYSTCFCAGTLLIETFGHYAKTPQFRDTLWEMELNMAQIIVWLFGFHGDMAVLCINFCYT